MEVWLFDDVSKIFDSITEVPMHDSALQGCEIMKTAYVVEKSGVRNKLKLPMYIGQTCWKKLSKYNPRTPKMFLF